MTVSGDLIVVGLLVIAFAVVMTTHVAIAFGLSQRAPRWRALLALLTPPLAPYWAWREHMRLRAGIWIAALVSYLTLLLVATRS